MESRKKTIFLDFDGVVHPVGCLSIEFLGEKLIVTGELLFCWAPILSQILERHNCDVVVHSTWRHHFSLTELRQRFPMSMQHCIVGITEGQKRHESILRYAEHHRIDDFIVLDDQPEEYPELWDRLVVCDSSRGIEDERIQGQIKCFLNASNRKS